MFFKKKENQDIENIGLSIAEEKREKYKQEKKQNKVALTKTELKRRLKYGTLSTVLTAVFVVAVILVNIIVNLVAEKIPDIDTSAQQYYELSKESIEYVESLKDYKIDIKFIGNETTLKNDSYYSKILRIADIYKRYSDNISISCVDLAQNPTFASKYSGVELIDGDAIVSCNDRYRVLNSGDFLVNTEETDDLNQSSSDRDDNSATYVLNAEYAITTAIMVFTASDHPVATVLNGHGEAEVENLTKLLENNGYTVNSTSLTKGIDKETNVLIIASPIKDYTEDELKQLDEFLDNDGKYGKNIFYIADYSQPVLPNLEAFLADWGFEISPGVVYESDSETAFAAAPYLNKLSYIDTNLTLTTALSEVSSFDILARPIKVMETLDVHSKNFIVLQHSDTTKVGTMSENGDFDKDDSETYPYVALAYTASSISDKSGNAISSNVIVADSLGFFSDQFFSKSYASSDVTIATVDFALGRETRLTLPTKSLTAAASNVTQKQADTIGIIVAVVIPFILLAACIFVYVRRRFL